MEIPLEWKRLARVSIRPSPLVPALVHVVGGPTRVQVASVGSTPIGPALDLHLLPASLLKLSLFPSLHPIQSGAPRHRSSRIGILPAPLADMGLLRQEACLLQPPLTFSVDVSFTQAGCLFFGRPFPNFFCSLGWWRRHASLRSSERRFLSSRQRSLASSVFLLFLRSRLRSPRRSVLLPSTGSSSDLPIIPPTTPSIATRKPKRKSKTSETEQNGKRAERLESIMRQHRAERERRRRDPW